MNILIIGATGFIGQHLLKELLKYNYNISCLVRTEEKGQMLLKKYNVNYILGDIAEPETLEALDDCYDIIYHLAAMGHVSAATDEAYQQFIKINVIGTQNIINKYRYSKRLKKFIHFSSTAAMGLIGEDILSEKSKPNPITPYQKSKYESEKVSLKAYQDYGFPAIVLRPCMVYGIGGYGEFYKFCRLMKKGVFPKVGRGKNLTPLVNVQDVVAASKLLVDKGETGEVYIIASNESISMDELHKLIMKNIGTWAPYIYVPAWIALSAAKIIENISNIIKIEPIVTFKNIKSTIIDRTFLIEKAKEELGYEPKVAFENGIKDTINWYKENCKI